MEQKYSIQKGIAKTAENSIPTIVIILANVANKFIGLDETSLNAVLTVGTMGFFWIKNFIKNKNKGV